MEHVECYNFVGDNMYSDMSKRFIEIGLGPLHVRIVAPGIKIMKDGSKREDAAWVHYSSGSSYAGISSCVLREWLKPCNCGKWIDPSDEEMISNRERLGVKEQVKH